MMEILLIMLERSLLFASAKKQISRLLDEV